MDQGTVLRRVLIAAVAIVVVALLAFIGTVCFYERSRQAEARRLLANAKALQIGESITQALSAGDLPEPRPLLFTSTCADANRFYTAETQFSPFDGHSTIRRLKSKFGFPPWKASLSVWTANDKICATEYSLVMVTDQGQKYLEYSVDLPKSDVEGKAAYIPNVVGGTYVLYALKLYPSATEEQRNKAFDLDLSCLTRSVNCRNACAVIQSAWPDFVALSTTDGFTLPSVDDRNCKRQTIN